LHHFGAVEQYLGAKLGTRPASIGCIHQTGIGRSLSRLQIVEKPRFCHREICASKSWQSQMFVFYPISCLLNKSLLRLIRTALLCNRAKTALFNRFCTIQRCKQCVFSHEYRKARVKCARFLAVLPQKPCT